MVVISGDVLVVISGGVMVVLLRVVDAVLVVSGGISWGCDLALVASSSGFVSVCCDVVVW